MTLGKIGARDTMYRWRNPYVTNGLVAMWDGEWNAGGGVHDAAATKWTDLSGNGFDFSLDAGNSIWGDRELIGIERTSGKLGMIDLASFGSAIGTVEFVGNPYHGWTSGTWGGDGMIFNGTFNNGTLVLRIRGYASRKVMQLMTVSSACPWYVAPGAGTGPENRTVSLSADIANGKAYAFGSEITPYTFVDQRGVSGKICLGAYYYNDTLNPYYGAINEIRIYSRALTASEIAANYAIDKERFNLP